ncbi:MAG TPA: hypothetical protein VIG24_07520 [Acidimicrobiia bacterium]
MIVDERAVCLDDPETWDAGAGPGLPRLAIIGCRRCPLAATCVEDFAAKLPPAQAHYAHDMVVGGLTGKALVEALKMAHRVGAA